MTRTCTSCGSDISPERLDVLPDTRVCVACSREPKKLCVPSYAHKTGGSIVILDPRDKETVRRARNQYRRTRWAG